MAVLSVPVEAAAAATEVAATLKGVRLDFRHHRLAVDLELIPGMLLAVTASRQATAEVLLAVLQEAVLAVQTAEVVVDLAGTVMAVMVLEGTDTEETSMREDQGFLANQLMV